MEVTDERDVHYELMRFELARDTLNGLIALHSSWIDDEEQRVGADPGRIAELGAERRRLVAERRELSSTDLAVSDQVIERYGPLVRAGLACVEVEVSREPG